MFIVKKNALCLVAAMAVCASDNLHAQERAAAGATETQMTWSALKSLVDDANAKSTAAHTRVDGVEDRVKNMEDCAAQGQLYDGAKCVAVNASGKDCNVTAESMASPILVGGKPAPMTSYMRKQLNGQYGLPRTMKDGEIVYYYKKANNSSGQHAANQGVKSDSSTFLQCLNGTPKVTSYKLE